MTIGKDLARSFHELSKQTSLRSSLASALQRSRQEHSEAISTLLKPPPPSPLVKNVEDNLASEFHHRLLVRIRLFDSSLDDQHEVGVRLVNFGQTFTFHLEAIGYQNPSLITFHGATEAGDPVELIQHVSQISILLMKLPRLEPDKPKRPIGFHSEC